MPEAVKADIREASVFEERLEVPRGLVITVQQSASLGRGGRAHPLLRGWCNGCFDTNLDTNPYNTQRYTADLWPVVDRRK